jgi:UDP-N-acetylglucosamine pyrophosphorylase
MSMNRTLAVVVMAAGKGTRMNNPLMAKVMYTVDDRPMVELVVELAGRLGAERVVVVVGWQKESVIAHLARTFPQALCVEQTPQLGTGHAVMQAEPPLQDFDGDVLVLSGDVPLLRLETLRLLLDMHRSAGVSATVLTAQVPDPTGYGRIIRDGEGRVTRIVEQKDASETERAVNEINSGIYVFDARRLFEGLRSITPDNAQKEYYLTDVFAYFWRNNLPVAAVVAEEAAEIGGINTLEQLEDARRHYRRLQS